jgi:predicted nucleic acid-binding protein
MRPLSCLLDPSAVLVADTSVAINLNASGSASKILRALPNKLVMVDLVSAELEMGRDKGRIDADLNKDLVEAGLINIVSLGSAGHKRFEELVIGRAGETLDDGEAGTLAYAAAFGATAIIDERKALRICAMRFSAVRTAVTVDIFAHPEIEKALGRAQLAEAVFQSLRDARMRVLENHVPWVLDLIGPDRAAQCTCLPRGARLSHFAGSRKESIK